MNTPKLVAVGAIVLAFGCSNDSDHSSSKGKAGAGGSEGGSSGQPGAGDEGGRGGSTSQVKNTGGAGESGASAVSNGGQENEGGATATGGRRTGTGGRTNATGGRTSGGTGEAGSTGEGGSTPGGTGGRSFGQGGTRTIATGGRSQGGSTSVGVGGSVVVPPACVDGAQKCSDGVVVVCSNEEWSVQTTCGDSSQCTETSATTAECAQPGALLVTTATVGRRLQPTTEPGTLQTARLVGARRSVQSFQVLVRGNGGPLQDVTVSTQALTGDGDASLAAENVTVFRGAYIDFARVNAIHGSLPAPQSSPTKDSMVPDPLIPLIDPYSGNDLGQPFDVQADLNTMLFVDVEIPLGTAAGVYRGAVTVAAGEESVDVPIEVEVWDLTLPDMNIITTYFGYSEDDIKNYHKDTYTCYSGNNDCWLNYEPRALMIAKRYAELLHDHRIDPGQFTVEEPAGCRPPTNWSSYDKAMEPYMDGSYFADGVPSGRINAPFTPGDDWGGCTDEQYTAVAKAWADHLKEKGWFDKVIVYAVDEPASNGIPYERIAEDSALMQAGDPDWKAHIMDTATAEFASIDVLGPALGIFCQALAEFDNWDTDSGRPYYGREEWAGLRAEGTQLWLYESNNQGAPYPTFATNALDGLEPTMMMWGSWYEYATGFLLWSTNYWDLDNPWGPNIEFGKSGDGVLMYPGNHDGLEAPAGSPQDIVMDGPVPSYRLKMIRTGLQDWALFAMADEAGLGDFAREQVHQVYRQLGGCDWEGCPRPEGGFFWKTDEVKMQEIRAAVVNALLGS